MANRIEQLAYGLPMTLTEQVDYIPGQIASKTLVQTEATGMSLFAIPAGESTGPHKSSGDALAQILQGKAKITISNKPFELEAGQSIVIPTGCPHALYAITSFKMLLTVIFE